jgi:hypothetical protein
LSSAEGKVRQRGPGIGCFGQCPLCAKSGHSSLKRGHHCTHGRYPSSQTSVECRRCEPVAALQTTYQRAPSSSRTALSLSGRKDRIEISTRRHGNEALAPRDDLTGRSVCSAFERGDHYFDQGTATEIGYTDRCSRRQVVTEEFGPSRVHLLFLGQIRHED